MNTNQIRLSLSALLFGALGCCNLTAAPFTPGNLVVLQIGDGTTSVSNQAVPVFLNEYTPAGATVQQIAVPNSASGSRLTVTGSSTSSGHLSVSSNGQYLVFGGFDYPVGGFGSSGTTTVSRVIGRCDMSGNIDCSTFVGLHTSPSTYGFSGGDCRCVVSVDGTAFWAAGNGTGGGIRYVPFGNAISALSTQVSSTPSNDRVDAIYNGQLYMTSQSGSNVGLNQVGIGLPTSTGTTTSLLAASGDAYGIAFASATRVFVTDNAAGLQQFDFNGTAWVLTSTFNSAGGLRGLALGSVSGTPKLFVTDSVASPNHLLVTDANSPGTFTTLVTAPTNAVLRGVVRIPGGAGVGEWNSYSK